MTSDVKVTLPPLSKIVTPSMRKAILERAAAILIGRIQRRTEQGLDVDGRPFEPYSEKYAKERSEAGREAGKVSLHLSGAMLGSMKVLSVDDKQALIGFEGSSSSISLAVGPTRTGRRGVVVTRRATARGGATVSNALKAKGHNVGAGHLPRRHFFGISPEDRRAIFDGIKRLLRF